MPGTISGASASTDATLMIEPRPAAKKRGIAAPARRVTAVTSDQLLLHVEVRLSEAAVFYPLLISPEMAALTMSGKPDA